MDPLYIKDEFHEKVKEEHVEEDNTANHNHETVLDNSNIYSFVKQDKNSIKLEDPLRDDSATNKNINDVMEIEDVISDKNIEFVGTIKDKYNEAIKIENEEISIHRMCKEEREERICVQPSPTAYIEVGDEKYMEVVKKCFKCPHCSYETHKRCNMRMHIHTHDDIKPFQCEVCNKEFNRKKALVLHKKDRHRKDNKKDYVCPNCSYQTNHTRNYKRHMNIHDDVKKFECDICKIRFREKNSLALHVRNKHTNVIDKEFKCQHCNFQSNARGALNKHMITHNVVKPYHCHNCSRGFNKKFDLELHIKNKHVKSLTKDFQCPKCSFETNYKANFQNHLGIHNNDVEPLRCHFCQKEFRLKRYLKVHIKDIHSEKEFQCSQCSYGTGLRRSLKLHMVTHNVDKSFECAICKARFRRKYTLQKHARTHDAIKSFRCDFCTKEFVVEEYLKKHLETCAKHTFSENYIQIKNDVDSECLNQLNEIVYVE